jgi:hypothetical protein
MTTPQSAEPTTASLAREWLQVARYYLGNRWTLVLLGTAVVVVGLALNWNWLVATGLAPIILAALPCLVMCGLGLCMSRLFGSSCESQPSQAQTPARPLATTTTTDGSSASVSTCCHDQSRASRRGNNQIESLEERRKPDA